MYNCFWCNQNIESDKKFTIPDGYTPFYLHQSCSNEINLDKNRIRSEDIIRDSSNDEDKICVVTF